MGAKILLVVEGMYLQADSIAYDAAFEYRVLRSLGVDVEVFVDRYSRQHYPDVPARPISELAGELGGSGCWVVYHWVDGWHEVDASLRDSGVPTVVRWHNNTPPWFFAPYSSIPTQKTVRGFSDLLRFAELAPRARFWVNSEFSRRQLALLGVDEERTAVVFPASHDLEHGVPVSSLAPPPPLDGERELRLLFVGRVVPHKGHRHVLAAAHAVQRLTGRSVRVTFPGRPDPDMPRYVAELRALAARLGIALGLPGEVSQRALGRIYEEADVFVGLSEHEGFGLPIIEAMARDLPVVGYRNTAVTDLLGDHPLACDDLEPVAVAKRILVAVESTARRREVAAWQRAKVLPRFGKAVLVEQVRAATEALGVPVTGDASSPAEVRAQPSAEVHAREIAAALGRWQSVPAPELDLPITSARDLRDHFVTRYDLAAYQTLLRTAARGSLRERALDLRFGSHRPLLGRFLALAKKVSLRLQDGLVRTIEISHNEIEHELASLSEKVDLLTTELARRHRTDPAGGGRVARDAAPGDTGGGADGGRRREDEPPDPAAAVPPVRRVSR